MDDVAATGATLAKGARARAQGGREGGPDGGARGAARAARARTSPRSRPTSSSSSAGTTSSTQAGRARRSRARSASRRGAATPSMKRVVVGTAGHIDHGKTSLVRALTGIDTDRLARGEAARHHHRARLRAPRPAGRDGGGRRRRARATSASCARWRRARAASTSSCSSWRRTRASCPRRASTSTSAGCSACPAALVAVTKATSCPALGAGLAPAARAGDPRRGEGDLPRGRAVVPVSATTRRGARRGSSPRSRALAAEVPERPADGPVFLPIDRAFSMKGFGTVVTGTLLSGQIAEGDEVALLPPSPGVGALRVRTVQVHGAATGRALAGQRTAVNLPGVEPSAVSRGQALVHAGVVPASSILDVELTLLAAAPRPLRHRAKLLLHVGTAQVGRDGRPARPRPSSRPARPRSRSCGSARRWRRSPASASSCAASRALAGRGKTVGGGRVLAVASPASAGAGGPRGSASSRRSPRGDADARSRRCSRWRGRPGSTPRRSSGARRSRPAPLQGAARAARGEGRRPALRPRAARVGGGRRRAGARRAAPRRGRRVPRRAPARRGRGPRGAARPAAARRRPAPLPAPRSPSSPRRASSSSRATSSGRRSHAAAGAGGGGGRAQGEGRRRARRGRAHAALARRAARRERRLRSRTCRRC